jgi:flagellar FliJ protein
MKQFQFRLEPVLDQRTKKEQEALLSQSRAQQIYQERLQLLQKTQTSLDSCMDMAGNSLMGEMHRLMYQDHLKSQMMQQTNMVQMAKNSFDRACQQTTKARQDRMIIEKLKEKRLAEYQQQILMTEAKQIDELATTMHNRKKM